MATFCLSQPPVNLRFSWIPSRIPNAQSRQGLAFAIAVQWDGRRCNGAKLFKELLAFDGLISPPSTAELNTRSKVECK